MSVSIVIPVFNEVATLRLVVEEIHRGIKAEFEDFEIILSENGSTDGSGALCDVLAKEFSFLRVIHQERADYGFALRRGLELAGKEWVINFSVDFFDLEFLRRVYAQREGFDLILGSKYLAGSEDQRPLWRQLGGRGYSLFFQMISGLPFCDTHGLKMMRTSAIQPLLVKCESGGATFENELVYLAYTAGLRIREEPLDCIEIRPSRSNNLSLLPKALVESVRVVGRNRFRRRFKR